MVFVLGKVAWALLRPSAVLVLLVAAGLAVLALRRGGAGAGVGAMAGVGWGMACTGAALLILLWALPMDTWVMRPLENRFPRPAPPERVDGIVVLGGAVNTWLSEDRGLPSLNDAAERMTEFVALARRYPQARLVFSGGNGDLVPGQAEAGPARALFTALGLPPERVIYEDQSRTTWENAMRSFDLLRPAPGEIWLLVTSASHMPRSMGAFRRAGWRPVAWPVGYKTTRTGLGVLGGPPGEHVVNLDWAVHEWVGMAAYYALGRSDALFPAP